MYRVTRRARQLGAQVQEPFTLLRREIKYRRPNKKLGITAPIIVYQMGKVGSSSIYDSLQGLDLDVPVYHIHYLNHLDETEAKIRASGSTHPSAYVYVNKGRALEKELQTKYKGKVHLISLTREPVSRNVSAFFESLDAWIPDLDNKWHDGRMTLEGLGRFYLDWFDHEYPLTWFDEQVRDYFGIDVFDHPFPRRRGYDIWETDRARLLLMRLEDLNHIAPEAMKKFLGIDAFQLTRSNVGSENRYAQIYKQFQDEIVLPASYLERMHKSKYASHFYSPEELVNFTRVWQRKLQPAVS